MEPKKCEACEKIKADEIIASAKIASDKVLATAEIAKAKWLYIDTQGKQRIFEIIITALLSAGIAFLTNLLSHFTAPNIPQTNIETAGLIGGIIKYVRSIC